MKNKNVVALKGANGDQRALIVNALREKANGDREAADKMEATPQSIDPAMVKGFIAELRAQANMADAKKRAVMPRARVIATVSPRKTC